LNSAPNTDGNGHRIAWDNLLREPAPQLVYAPSAFYTAMHKSTTSRNNPATDGSEEYVLCTPTATDHNTQEVVTRAYYEKNKQYFVDHEQGLEAAIQKLNIASIDHSIQSDLAHLTSTRLSRPSLLERNFVKEATSDNCSFESNFAAETATGGDASDSDDDMHNTSDDEESRESEDEDEDDDIHEIEISITTALRTLRMYKSGDEQGLAAIAHFIKQKGLVGGDNPQLMKLMAKSWRDVEDYKAPTSIYEARERCDGEGQQYMNAAIEEMNWLKFKGVVRIRNGDDLADEDKNPTRMRQQTGFAQTPKTAEELAHDKSDHRQTLLQKYKLHRWTWAFARKRRGIADETGTPTGSMVYVKVRARLTIKGCDQVKGKSYDATKCVAPVVHISSIHFVHTMIVCFNLHVVQCDDSKAFFEGSQDYDIMAKVPDGFEHDINYAPFGDRTVWECIGAIYGTKQAARLYFDAVREHLLSLSFIQCTHDACVWIKWFDSEQFMIFYSHVDDRKVGYMQQEHIDWFMREMNKRFTTNIESDSQTLGMDWWYSRDKGHAILRSTSSITGFLKKHRIEDIKEQRTPMTPAKEKLMTRAACPSTDEQRADQLTWYSFFRAGLGFIGYIANTTHPQFKSSVRIVCQFMSNPGREHLKAVRHMLGYMRYSRFMGVHYKRPKFFTGSLWFTFLSDTDMFGNKEEGYSTMGGVVYCCDNYCYSYSKKIKSKTMSTAGTEIIGMSEMGQFAVYMHLMARSLKFRLQYPSAILGDNMASLIIAKNPTAKYARHIAMRDLFIRSLCDSPDFVVAYIETNWNISDMHTKSLDVTKFTEFTKYLLQGINCRFLRGKLKKTLKEIREQVEGMYRQRELSARRPKQLEQRPAGENEGRWKEDDPSRTRNLLDELERQPFRQPLDAGHASSRKLDYRGYPQYY
jgi:hypothetical protein